MIPNEKIKLVLVGDSGVGKSALLRRFSKHMFTSELVPTIGIDLCIYTHEEGDNNIKFHIWDTAGLEKYRPSILQYLRDADGIIIVHDASQPVESYVQIWRTRIQEYNSHCPIFLLHTKTDLIEESEKKIYSFYNVLDIGYVSSKFTIPFDILFTNLYSYIRKHRNF